MRHIHYVFNNNNNIYVVPRGQILTDVQGLIVTIASADYVVSHPRPHCFL